MELEIQQELDRLEVKCNIVLPPLSWLIQQNKLSAVIRSIQRIKTSPKTKQLFVWATVKNIGDGKVVPFVEHLADIVVNIRDKKTLTILTKRSSGSVTKKVRFLFSLNCETMCGLETD